MTTCCRGGEEILKYDRVLLNAGDGLNPDTGEMLESVEDQTFQTLNNMAQILEVSLTAPSVIINI